MVSFRRRRAGLIDGASSLLACLRGKCSFTVAGHFKACWQWKVGGQAEERGKDGAASVGAVWPSSWRSAGKLGAPSSAHCTLGAGKLGANALPVYVMAQWQLSGPASHGAGLECEKYNEMK